MRIAKNWGHLEMFIEERAWKNRGYKRPPMACPFYSFHLPLIFFPCRLKLTPHLKGPTQAIKLNDVPDSSVDQ